MPQNNLQPLYQAASKKFNLGSYEDFEKGMRDPKLRKSFYDAASKKFNLGNYDQFNSTVDSLTSVPGQKTAPVEKLTETKQEVKEPVTKATAPEQYSWGRPTGTVLGRGDATATPEWRAGQRPLTDYATADKEPVTADAIWKTGINVIGAKNPDEYDFINRRMELGPKQLNEFTKFKVEKEGVKVNAEKISGLLDQAKVAAEKQKFYYESGFNELNQQMQVAGAAGDVEWQKMIQAEGLKLEEEQKNDPAFKQYNDLITKYNDLVKYEKDLPAKYPMVKEQQAEAQKVQQEYKEGGFWSKLYFQTAYPSMGAFMEMSKNIMGASDHIANLTGLMSNDELQDYTEYKKGTIAMPTPDETELFNPGTGKFQAAGILPTMFKVGLQSYGFYKGGAILNKTGIPMGASQWLSVFTQTYPMFYEQGIENGLTTNQAQSYAALSSATEAMIERILPEEKIFESMLPNAVDVFKGAKLLEGGIPTKMAEFTKGYMKVAIPEVTEEVLSDIANNITQYTANEMTSSNFDVKPINFQDESKTIVTTAIGMIPMSLVGGYNQINNITKVARYEAGLAPKTYIDFADKEVAAGNLTQKSADEIAGTATMMAEIIDQIPDKSAGGRVMSKEKKIEIANLIFEQGKLEAKKKNANKLFSDSFDEAAADLEEKLNKAYGIKDTEKEAETVAPVEPVVAADEQTDALDEDIQSEIEGLKGDIAANAPKETKIETVGGKEFYSHEGNEYEVKRGKTGELEFEGSATGKAITRKSANYDKVVAGYVAEKYADAPETEVTAESEEAFYSEISTKSNNPLEILLTAAQADKAEGENQQASAKDLFLSQHHISFNAEDVRRKFGHDISDMGNWQALRDNFYKADGEGIDQSVVDLNLNEEGERFTEDDLWDYMERNPKGLDESTLMGPHTKALGERFTAITGAPFDRRMLDAFKEVQDKASRIPESDQAAMFDWFAAHPQGTIEEIQTELQLSPETKTVLDETEEFKYPWETEGEQSETDKGSTDVAPVEAEQPKEKEVAHVDKPMTKIPKSPNILIVKPSHGEAPTKPNESKKVIKAINDAAKELGMAGSTSEGYLEDQLPETVPAAIEELNSMIATSKKNKPNSEGLKLLEAVHAKLSPVKEEAPAAPVKTELDTEIDNFVDLFKKIKKKRSNPGIINDPEQNAEDDLELISAGAKLVKVAMKTGLHKFADIVSYAAKRIGDAISEVLPYMQKAYTSLLGDTSISEDDLDKMDDPKTVRNFKLPATNETEPTISGDSTLPDAGSGDIPQLPGAKQPELFDGTVQQPETKTGGGGRSKPGTDNERPTVKGRKKRSGSAGDNQSRDTVPEGPAATDERTDDPNIGTNNEENPKPPRSVIEPEARNFVITPETVIVPAGEIGKIKANIAAIKLLKQLESEKRQATPAEKEILAQFVGWGGVSTVLSVAKSNETGPTPWKTKYLKYHQDLKAILTPDEWNAAVGSTTNAHYTERSVIEQLWGIAQQMGFIGGKVLESSAGIGHIIGLMPSSLQPAVNASMVELDSISGRIMKMLYPENSTQVTGFEEAKLNPASYDLAITNVPFGQHAPFDKVHSDIAKFSLHNYFMAKNMRMVKPGGLGVFISTWRSMDHSASAEWRRYMDTHEDVDFIGAIKLPNSAQDANAGTQVTTDIIILQKRVQPGKKNPVAQPWINDVVLRTATGKEGDDIEITVNEYFKEHPEMMLGDYDLAYLAGSGGLYGADEQTLVARRGIPLTEQIEAAAKNLPRDITSYQPSTEDNTQFAEDGDQEGTYVTNDKGEVFFVDNGERVAVPFAGDKVKLKGKEVAVSNVIKLFVDLKAQVKRLVSAERSVEATEADIDEQRVKLRRLYSSFVDRYGVFNRNSNISFLLDDSESMLVYALETLKSKFVADKAGRIRTKVEVYPSDILYKRVNHPYIIPTKADNITDAVNLSLVFHGNIDLDYISSLLGDIKREDAARLTLENGLGYEDPQTGEIIEKDIYLSGNVREKLKAAEAAMQSNPRFEANYDALKGVQPTDIPMRLITPALGAGWIPVEMYERFFAEVLGRQTAINYNPKLARNQWSFGGVSSMRNEWRDVDTAAATWGVLGYDGATLAGYAMNLTDVVVRDPDPVNRGKYIKNLQKTEQVNNKIDDIRAEFVRWLKETDELHEQIEKQFNETQNSYVEYQNSRTIKRFPGQSEIIDGKEFGLREHQSKAVLRALRQSVLLAHGVGSGKTYTIITAAMEMKRLKLANKPMIVAWNETLEQFTESARKLYPAAKILSPTANQMDAKNRQRLIASMVYGDWDMIIIPHSFMKFIPNDPEREIAYLRQRIAELEETKDGAEDYVIADIDNEISAIEEMIIKKSTKKVKDVAKSLQGVTKRVKKQLSARRDQTFLFEESGIDALFIDEADAFKKIGFTTAQRSVRGIDVTGSQKALDAYMKTQWVRENNAGRNVVLATGTPVTNTLAEVWTMMRYVAPETLRDLGIETFDQFATSFANIDKTVEMTAGNTFKEISRLKTYKNAPALISAFRNNADVVISSDVKEFQEDNTLPKVVGGEAEKVVIEMSEPLEKVMKGIQQTYEWWEKLKGKEKKANKHVPLVLYGLAKKAAVDVRLLNTPSKRYEDDPKSKLNDTVRRAFEIYKKNGDIKGMQLIFCDSINSKDGSFNSHQEIKKKLIGMGVPESEIVIADDKFKGNRRMKAMDDARDGTVRFMIGHTDRLGVGLNVQTRCVALFHVDAPPRPRDYEQRNGRIIRQGNMCAVPVNMGGFDRPVHVINMGVKNTLDRLAYERLQFKQFFINQILSGKVEWGEMEDPTEEINPSDLQHGAMGALLGGSQTGIKINELRRQLRKIESGYDNFTLKLRNLTTRRNYLRTQIPFWRDVRKPALDAFIKDIPNYTDDEGTVNKVVINGKPFSKEVKPVSKEDIVEILNDKYQGWEKTAKMPEILYGLTANGTKWSSDIKNAVARALTLEGADVTQELENRLGGKLGVAIENAVAESRNKATTEQRTFNNPAKTVIKIGDSFVATVNSYETKILDKEDAKRYNAAMGAKIVTSDLSLYETLNDKAFNFQYANSGSIIQRIYPEITAAQKEVNEIDPNIQSGEQELKDIDIELKKPFIGMDDMTKIRSKIDELQKELVTESNSKPEKEVVLTEDAQAILDGVKKDIDEALTNEDETTPSEDDNDDDFTPDDGGSNVEEPPSDALYNMQQKIEGRLDNLEKGLDDAFDGISGAYILPPKPILKAALKIIRYSVKAGFSIARAMRNAYNYIKTTDWYKKRVADKNPYDIADLQSMLVDYGVTQADDLDSLDRYLKRIKKFVNGAPPGEIESALNNLTNFITQRVKTIGASDTRFFLDAIDRIRKSQGNPTRLATAIVRFEKAVDEFIYREQYREAIRAKREARRNLIKLQKFPDIRLLGIELVNLPIVKSREKIPIDLLWRYLEAINPLAVKGKELLPNVKQIREVIRDVMEWANSVEEKESTKAARDTTESDARKEQQMDQWREEIDKMKSTFNPASITRSPEIDAELQQMIREFIAIDHNGLEYGPLHNYWGILVNLSQNQLVSPNLYDDWVLPARKEKKVSAVASMAREVKSYFDGITKIVNQLRSNPKTLWDPLLLKPDPKLQYDAPFWQHFIQPLTNAIEKFRIDYQTVEHQMNKLYDRLGKNLAERSKAAMQVRMWAFANQVDHNRPDIDFKKKLNQSIANMANESYYSDIFSDYQDAFDSLVFSPEMEAGEGRLIDLEATFDAFTPAQKAFAQGLATLITDRLQPIVQYQQMYVRGENVNFIEGYHPMAVLGGVNVEEAKTEAQVNAMLTNNGLGGSMVSTKAGSMFARTYPKKVYYSFTYPSLLDSIEGTLFDKHLTQPIKEVFGAMINPSFTDSFTSSLASEMRNQMMSMLKHEIGFNEQAKNIEQRIVDSLIRSLTGSALVSIKRFAEFIPNWSVAAPHIADNPYDAVKMMYNSSREFFDHPREWLEMMRENGFSVYMRFSTHSELIDTPGGNSLIIHNPFLNPLKHLRESRTTRKAYDHKNKTKFDQLATDALAAFTNNDLQRMGTLIQQLSIGIGDYASSFPIWVASFQKYLAEHGYQNVDIKTIKDTVPADVVTAAGNYAEGIIDRSVGASNRGRAAEKTYSFSSEAERKKWYAYAIGRFTYFLGVLMYQQTSYFRHHASSLITGKGEYGRLRAAGVLAGLVAGNVAFNTISKVVGAIVIGLGGDDEAKKSQLADLKTKEYWARNVGSALLQLSIMGKLPYFTKILFSLGVEAANKYITEEVAGKQYDAYHDSFVYAPRLPLPTEWAQSKAVYNTFMPWLSPIDKIITPMMAGLDMVGNGNPNDDALAKYNLMKAALGITNLAIHIPFVNKEVYGVLNAAGMPVKPSEYESQRDVKKEMEDAAKAAKLDYEKNYSTMPKDDAAAILDSLILEETDPVKEEKLRNTKKVVMSPKYDQMTAHDKYVMGLPVEAKIQSVKTELEKTPAAGIKDRLDYYRSLGVLSAKSHEQLMDEMYYSDPENRKDFTPGENREYIYRTNKRKNQ